MDIIDDSVIKEDLAFAIVTEPIDCCLANQHKLICS